LGFEVELFDSLDEVQKDAAGTLDREAQADLFDRLSWFRLVARHHPPPGRLLVARAQTQDGAHRRTRHWLFLAVDKGRAQGWANWYSLRVGAVGHNPDQGATPDCLEALARALRRSRRVTSLQLYPYGCHPRDFLVCFRKAGWLTRATPAGVSWQICTQDMDFARFWASRPSRLRNSAERKAKAACLDIKIHSVFDAEAWADYESVYAASWKPEEGSPAFLKELAEQEGTAGTLRLGVARKDGVAVAAQLWTVENGRAYIHKLAYREDAKAMSPGTVLSMAMFRAAIDEDRVIWIDYGTGDDAYKRDWMEHRAELMRVEAWHPGTLRGLAGAARAALSALVRRLRSR
jgi:CelD/BcsL family acetyltransferase involved in cellulose biosynthesis